MGPAESGCQPPHFIATALGTGDASASERSGRGTARPRGEESAGTAGRCTTISVTGSCTTGVGETPPSAGGAGGRGADDGRSGGAGGSARDGAKREKGSVRAAPATPMRPAASTRRAVLFMAPRESEPCAGCGPPWFHGDRRCRGCPGRTVFLSVVDGRPSRENNGRAGRRVGPSRTRMAND